MHFQVTRITVRFVRQHPRDGQIGADVQTENAVVGFQFVVCRGFVRHCREISLGSICWQPNFIYVRFATGLDAIVPLLGVCPISTTSTAISVTAESHRFRKLTHRPVIGQRGFRIRLFWFPLHGLTHYQPPQMPYISIFAPTATKC